MDETQNHDEIAFTPPVEPTVIENIVGHIKIGAGAPTYTPKAFWDSLYLNTTTGALYAYDFTSSAWKTGSSTVYGGFVTSNAAGTPFPANWTVVENSAGNYTVTHNLGTMSYTPTATAVGNDTLHAIILSKSSNSFIVIIANNAGSDVDGDFMFQVAT